MQISEISTRLAKFTNDLYERLNQRTSGWVAVLARAGLNFSHNRASLTAAAISFFTIFSVFPLLVFMISLLNSFADQPTILNALHSLLSNSFPVSLEDLWNQVNSLVSSNDSINIIALIGFLWAASGMFNILLISINYAWGIDNIRSRLQSRVIALAIVTFFAVIFAILLIIVSFIKLVMRLLLPLSESIFLLILPMLIQFLIIFILYKIGPATNVKSKSAVVGAITASLSLEILTSGFSWYLNSDWSTYNVLYGSLGAIIGLLFWVYLSSLIILFCAYLSEASQTRWNSEHPAQFRVPLF